MLSENIHIIPLRGSTSLIDDLQLLVDDTAVEVASKPIDIEQQSNIRVIFENTNSKTIKALIPEKSLVSSDTFETKISDNSDMKVRFGSGLFEGKVNLKFEEGDYLITKSVYFERPEHTLPELSVIPIPTDVLTVHIECQKLNGTSESSDLSGDNVDALFDAFSHLGFFLVDQPKFKKILQDKYGSDATDLITELTTTELVEELFQNEIVMMVWGINPYTYPIYSVENPDEVLPVLGEEFESAGIYNVDESIQELSVIPGSALRNYPNFLEESWQKIKLFGQGKRTVLKPYQLKDADGETVMTSFLVHRDSEPLNEAVPLVNVNLLYQ